MMVLLQARGISLNTEIIIAPCMAAYYTWDFKRKVLNKKCPKKWRKSTIFLTPPLPPDNLDFLEIGENLKQD